MKYTNNSILELIRFLSPRLLQLGYNNFLEFIIDIMIHWEERRTNPQIVELFYLSTDFLEWNVPDYLKRGIIDSRLICRIVDFNSPKLSSLSNIASQLEVDKSTLKKILSKTNPKLSSRLKDRKKLSFSEMHDVLDSIGWLETFEDDSIEASKIFKITDVYTILNTDKQTLNSNLSKELRKKISGLNLIPPSILKEIIKELDGEYH